MAKQKTLRTLDQIMLGTGTDKASTGHGYSKIYDELFTPWRLRPLTFLELGVWEGASLRAWAEYFTSDAARIIGVDNDLGRYNAMEDERVTAMPVQLDSQAGLDVLVAAIATPIDIVVDDASHGAFQQHISWNNLWPRVVPGGLYVIEDLHTYFWKHSNPATAKDWLHGLADSALGMGAEPRDNAHEVEAITFRASMCIMQKRRSV